MRRLVVLAGLTLMLGACTVATPFTTSAVVKVADGVQRGYRYEYYENRAYTCGASGYQTFLLVWKDGLATTTPRPLWVRLHGGGVGAFNGSGDYVPAFFASSLDQEGAAGLASPMTETGLTALARTSPAGFRFLFPSLCDHDIYSGIGMTDPNNPHSPDENGNQRATDGLLAAKAAIAYTRSRVATTETILHGTSAGSYGALYAGWGLEEQGMPVTGIVMDSGVYDALYTRAMQEYLAEHPDACAGSALSGQDFDALRRRFALLATTWWDPADAVRTGSVSTPLFHLWDRRDPSSCSDTPIPYTDEDGNPQVMGASDLHHWTFADAVTANPPGGVSRNLRVCTARAAGGCGEHTPTTDAATDADTGVDINAEVMAWVDGLLAA